MLAEAIAPLHTALILDITAQSPSPEVTALQAAHPHIQFTLLTAADLSQLCASSGPDPVNWQGALDWLQQHPCDAAFILTEPGQTPYTLGYLCYLAGIPIRIGRSPEFGGQVLTHVLS